jgi:hypothetical protein
MMMLQLRSEMGVERGQAMLDCICMDEGVLKGIGAAQQLSGTVGTVPDELVKLLKQGPAQHLLGHAYEYRRKFDVELASIKRIKELQVAASPPQLPIPVRRPASLATGGCQRVSAVLLRHESVGPRAPAGG